MLYARLFTNKHSYVNLLFVNNHFHKIVTTRLVSLSRGFESHCGW